MKYWGLRLIISIASFYLFFYILFEWVEKIKKLWILFPTSFLLVIVFIIIIFVIWASGFEESPDGGKE